MRRPPGDHAAFLGSTEHFLDVPLTAESMHNATGAPVVSIRAQHPSAQPRLLKLAAQCGVNVPAQARRLVVASDLGHDEVRQMFPRKHLVDPLLQAAARDASRFY